MHKTGAMGDRLRHSGRLHPTNNTSEQVPVPSIAGRQQRRIVSNQKLNCNKLFQLIIVNSGKLVLKFIAFIYMIELFLFIEAVLYLFSFR